MASYTRQSTFSDGDLITAALFNDEYNQLVAAFNNTTGHKHDGTTGEGPVISVLGDSGIAIPLNKILIDTTNNHIEFYVNVSGTSTQQIYIADGAIVPTTDNDIDLGTNSLQFKDLYINGTANIDSLVADTADINGGTIDGVVIGGSSAGAITGTAITGTSFVIGSASINETELEILDGATLTTTELNFVDGVTSSIQTQIDTKAPLASPNLTGIPTAPTAASNTNTTQLATTAYVQTEITELIGGAPGTLDTLNELAAAINDDSDYNTTLTTALATKLPLAGGTMTGNLNYSDNVKAQFGTSNDLEIYHDGSNSIIADVGTGDLIIQAGNDLILNDPNSTEYLRGNQGAGVQINHNGSTKLLTTSTGIDVTGTITADGLTVDDITINGSTISDGGDFTLDVGGDIELNADGSTIVLKDNTLSRFTFNLDSTPSIQVQGTSLEIETVTGDADILFKGNDNGVDVTALTLDMSDAGKALFNAGANFGSNVTVGGNLTVSGVDVNITANVNHAGDGDTFFGFHGNDLWRVVTGNSERLEVSNSGIIINDGGVDADFRVESNNNAAMLFVDGGNDRVGIGTTSPARTAVINSSGTSTLQITNDTTGVTTTDGLQIKHFTSGATQIWNYENNYIAIGTNNTERVRIDSSGHLLVGKTASSVTTDGVELLSSGFVRATVNGDTVLQLNRKTSDGTIVNLRKDGTTVGSIGTDATDIYIGTTDTGIRFNDAVNGVLPYNTSSGQTDGTIDLGFTSVRWRDLYLSGTANFGSLSDGTITITGFVDEDNMSSDSATLVPTQQSVKAYVDSQVSSAGGSGISFADNEKAKFGASSDLQIFHDSSDSFIKDEGDGNLRISSNGAGVEINKQTSEYMARFLTDGAVELYHNNSKKLETTSTGVDVTGTVTSDGLTVNSDTILLDSGSSAFMKIDRGSNSTFGIARYYTAGVEDWRLGTINDSTSNFYLQDASSIKRFQVATNGDISFYDDTGSTQGLFWDASKESLAIGTTSLTPTDGANIELSSSTSSRVILDSTGTGGRKWTMATGLDGRLDFYDYDASAYRMSINASGSVGIGTTSPSGKIHVKSGSTPSIAQLIIGHNNTSINYFDANTHIFRNGSSQEKARITSTGNFGINTTSPTPFLANSKVLEISDDSGVGSELILTNNSAMSADEIVGSLIFKNTDASGTPNHFAGLRARAESTFGRMDLEFYAGRSRMEGGTPDMVIIPNGADAQANVGIGTTSPNKALTVAQAQTSGAAVEVLRLTGSGSYSSSGSIGAGAALSFGQYHDTYPSWNLAQIDGIRDGSSWSGALVFRTNNSTAQTNSTERMRLDSSGRLFIGATSASALNTFSDDLIISNTASGTGAGISIVSNATNGYSNIHFGDTDDADIGRIQYNNTTNAMTLRTNTSDAITINSSQNVGIGTASPRGTLDLGSGSGDGTLSNTPSNYQLILEAAQSTTGDIGRNIAFVNGTNNVSAAINSYDAGTGVTNGLVFATAASGTLAERMRLDSSGRLGIGTASPDAPLTVHSSSDPEIRLGYSASQDHRITWDSAKLFLDADPDNANANSALGFRVDGSEAGRFDASGNFLVGKTSNSFSTAGFTVTPSGTIQPVVSGGATANFNRLSSDGDIVDFRKDGSIVGSIGASSGSVAINARNTGILLFQSGGNEKARIDSSGRLFLGTSTVATANTAGDDFVIKGSGTGVGMTIAQDNANGTGSIFFGDPNSSSAGSIRYNHNTGDMALNVEDNLNISADKVGIGTTSPQQKLTVNGATFITSSLTSPGSVGSYTYNGTAIDYFSNGTRYWSWGDATNRGTFAWYQLESDGQNQITSMTLDTSGRLGIGTASPISSLTVLGANDVQGGITLTTSNSNSTQKVGRIKTQHYNTAEEPFTAILTNAQAANNVINIGGASGAENAATEIKFYTAGNNTTLTGSERARIDSNGTVLVGKTAEGTATDGIELNRQDVIVATRNGDAPLILNRRTSDGDIALFRKDNTTVGSINAVGGDLAILSTTSNHKGLRFGSGAITPTTNTGAIDNGNTDLGGNTIRFKNLFLNGTVNGNKIHLVNNATDDTILLESTEDSSTAAPVLAFKRNSSSPADADYLGQLKFKGENDADQEIVYAKITAKISDASDGTEDGLLEFANKKAGSNVITARLTSDSLKLLNGTALEVNGAITSDGNITAFSDERLKDNIQTLEGSKVLEMRGVSYVKDGENGSGVIAQEIEKVAPELVHTAKDEMGTKSVAYGNLVGYLIEAVKEQQKQIDELKGKLDDITG